MRFWPRSKAERQAQVEAERMALAEAEDDHRAEITQRIRRRLDAVHRSLEDTRGRELPLEKSAAAKG